MIIDDRGKILAFSIISTGHNVKLAGENVLKLALEKADLSMNDLGYMVSTGYGRRAIEFSDEVVPEILCHAKGAKWLIPSVKTVIDIGGQDSKVIEVNEKGNVTAFAMNDKCAAGTGRFLEVLSKILDLDVEQLGPLSLKARRPCSLSSTCTVFAESEVVSYLASGESRENIIAGLHKAIAKRVISMGKSAQILYERDIVFTGGVAKNTGVCKAIGDELGEKIFVPEEPQIVGALGAALFSLERRSLANRP